MGPPGGDWDETVIPVGKSTEGFDVSPDGKELWAANAENGTVAIIDLSAKKVTNTLHANVRGANRLKFTPDGKLVFISSLSDSGLAILDTATHKEVKRLDLGHGAAGIEMQPDGSRIYVACTGGNYVAMIDRKTLTIVGRINAGPEPDGLAWSVQP
jgi:YVTN family beta-propeller protein